MKKLVCNLLTVSLCFIILGIFSNVPAQIKSFDHLQKDVEMAETLKRIANRSSEGLVKIDKPDGSMMVDLQGRFQHVMLSRIDEYGKPRAGCISSLNEANAFMGRNLETGELYPIFNSPINNRAKQSAQHGMSPEEFAFYKNLVDAYQAQLALNPNSATITIINGDGPGEGFNDPTVVVPEGGNLGVTLGQQRLNVFNAAAAIWGAFLDSSVTIQVNSQFNPLPCSPTSGVLGSAGTTTVHGNFANVILLNTWHHQALANKQAGSDLSANPDMNATFNSSLNGNPGCLGGSRFYLGLDNASPGGNTNLLIVLLHEMAHGLGFSDFADAETGTLFNGFPDVFTTFMFDRTTMKFWNNMTNAERMASAINNNNVLWDGASIKLASGNLTNGREAATGRVELYTPNPVEGGSSISHWNLRVFPNALMEPFINFGLPLDLDLTRQLMRDVGWYRDTNGDVVPDTITNVTPSGGTILIGSQQTINWTNTGGFNRNIIVELSIDGGVTYPTVLASNFANSGTLTFTVPNTPTSQGKIRVREFNFANPSGESAANFTISSTILTGNPIFDFDGDGKTDVGIFRPSVGEWWYLRSSDGGNRAFQFGASSDEVVAADYTGDGKTDLAIWRPSSGEWFVLRSEDNSFYSFPFGASGDIPAPADFDGDGKDDPAVFRPSTGTWFIIRSSDNGVTITNFGANGDLPVAADYDGDGKADVAVFRPSDGSWWLNRSSAGVVVTNFGTVTDKAVPADYTGDGKADVAIFRPSTGEWFILRSEDFSFYSVPFGTTGDIPAPGDYDGDGIADLTVFRPSNNTWFILRTTAGFTAVTFGATGDQPIPNAYVR